MVSNFQIIILIHLIGLILAVGSATVKLMLLIKSKSDLSFIPVFLKIVRPVTKLLITGLVVTTLSGITFFFLGYPFTTLMIIKTILVGIVWVIGPYIDKAIEPKYIKLAPAPGAPVMDDFIAIQNKFLFFEITATSIFYVCVVMGVLL